MPFSSIIFYTLAAAILFFALLTVTTRRIFRAAIYLLVTLVCTAGIYFGMQNEFIAAVQIVVYVGGIVVLILFAIFLTHQAGTRLEIPSLVTMASAGALALSGILLSVWAVNQFIFGVKSIAAQDAGMKVIGKQLLSLDQGGYILPFEVVSVLLLATMIGAIIIAQKPRSNE
jgi:NADH-quinone oxidoreductase subunit J